MNAPAQRERSARHALRDAGAALLWALGRTRPARSAAGALTIVTFHRVLPPEQLAAAPLPGLCVTPRFLDGALAHFARHYRCLRVSDALREHASGTPSPKPLLAISFDDGRGDNFEHARPLLAKHGVRATFYVVADAIDAPAPLWPDAIALEVQALARRDPSTAAREVARVFGAPLTAGAAPNALPDLAANLAKAWPAPRIERALAQLRERTGGAAVPRWERPMRWGELAELAREGHEIGSHSATHAILVRACAPDLGAEVAGSKRTLESGLGVPVEGFCYPSGLYDEATLAAVAAAGYSHAATTRDGANRELRPFELQRTHVDGELNATRGGAASEPVLAWRVARAQP